MVNEGGRGFTVSAVGDLQLGDSSICVGFGFHSRYSQTGLAPLFARTGTALPRADVVFGNLETTLSASGLRRESWHSMQMRGEPAFATQLRAAGFTIMNVANNHAVQHGPASFQETLALLRDAGIQPCGVRGTGEWCSEPVRLPLASGLQVGVLSYCHRPRQYGDGVPPYAEGTLAQMVADVSRLRPTVDHVIISLHWGEEFVAEPSEDEVRQARALIDAGAVLIVGHHPHVLRPVERYRGGLIAYSLGNFVADMVWLEDLRRGALLQCAIDSGGVRQATLTRTRIGDDFVPEALGAAETVTGALPGPGLDPVRYQAAIDRTISAQRRAAYGYALRHLYRFPPRILAQLAGVTLRNKLEALLPASHSPAR